MTSYTLSSHQIIGGRDYQEDRLVCKELTGDAGETIILMVICDGHGGSEVSEKVASYFEQHFEAPPRDDAEVHLREFVAECHRQTESEVAGTTLSVALVWPKNRFVVTGILGDSPIIAGTREGVLFVGEEHNISTNHAEEERVMAAGAVRMGPYMYHPGGHRGLQLTRALGDKDLKSLLSRELAVETFTLPPGAALLVCSDGLPRGHGLDEDEAGPLVYAAITSESAEALISSRSRNRYFADNVTALLLQF